MRGGFAAPRVSASRFVFICHVAWTTEGLNLAKRSFHDGMIINVCCVLLSGGMYVFESVLAQQTRQSC